MRRSLLALLSCCLACALAPPAFAQGFSPGLNLAWDQCLSAGGATSKSFACDVNTGPPLVLVPSVVIPVAMPQFVGAEIVVDFHVAAGALPAWWQTAAGQCRVNAMSTTFDPFVLGDLGCANIWMDTPNFSAFTIQYPAWFPDVVRVRAAAAVSQGSEIALAADGTELTVARVAISKAKSTGPGACAGCASIACILFAEARLQQPPGVGDYVLAQPSTLHMAWLNAPGWGGWWCEIPTLDRTWGAIKQMYR